MNKILITIIALFALSGCSFDELKAKVHGFNSVKEMHEARAQGFKTKNAYSNRYKSLGFASLDEMTEANELGFRTNDEYQAHLGGFSTIEEMNTLQARGYRTKGEFNKVVRRDPRWFMETCSSADEGDYARKCYGKRLAWFGQVKKVEDSYIRIEIRDTTNYNKKAGLEIDSKNALSFGLEKKHIGYLMYFEGELRDKNFLYPDMEEVTYIEVMENEEERVARVQLENKLANDKKLASQKERAKAEAAAAIEKKQNILKHQFDAAWLSKNFFIDASSLCKPKIESLANYDFEWTDSLIETKFDAYDREVKHKHTLTIKGDKLKLQNGFGAWKSVRYWCDYDPLTDSVVAAGIF